jgi:hypothetical protein
MEYFNNPMLFKSHEPELGGSNIMRSPEPETTGFNIISESNENEKQITEEEQEALNDLNKQIEIMRQQIEKNKKARIELERIIQPFQTDVINIQPPQIDDIIDIQPQQIDDIILQIL